MYDLARGKRGCENDPGSGKGLCIRARAGKGLAEGQRENQSEEGGDSWRLEWRWGQTRQGTWARAESGLIQGAVGSWQGSELDQMYRLLMEKKFPHGRDTSTGDWMRGSHLHSWVRISPLNFSSDDA